MRENLMIWNVAGWVFGLIVFAISIINTFWGNDPGFGIFLLVLSFVFFPPVNEKFQKFTGFSVRWWMKVLLGLFILWSSLGVGELFDKTGMMLEDVQQIVNKYI